MQPVSNSMAKCYQLPFPTVENEWRRLSVSKVNPLECLARVVLDTLALARPQGVGELPKREKGLPEHRTSVSCETCPCFSLENSKVKLSICNPPSSEKSIRIIMFHQPQWYISCQIVQASSILKSRENSYVASECCRWKPLCRACLFQRLFFDLDGGWSFTQNLLQDFFHQHGLDFRAFPHQTWWNLKFSSRNISYCAKKTCLTFKTFIRPSTYKKNENPSFNAFGKKYVQKTTQSLETPWDVAPEKIVDLFEGLMKFHQICEENTWSLVSRKLRKNNVEMGRNLDLPCPDLPSNSNSGLV